MSLSLMCYPVFFFFNDTATTEIYTLSLHDALLICLAGLVLVHRDQRRHAAALEVFGTHGMAGAFRRDHDHVHIGWRHDLVVVNIKAVSERQCGARLQV